MGPYLRGIMEKIRLQIFTISEDGTSFGAFRPFGEDIILDDFVYSAQRMGSTEITCTLRTWGCLDELWTGREAVLWPVDQEWFMLSGTPSSEKVNTDGRYSHQLRFRSERDVVLANTYFTDAVSDSDSADRALAHTTVRFCGTLQDFADRVNACIRWHGLDGSFIVSVADGILTEERFVEFEDVFIMDALRKAFEEWDIPFRFDGNECVFMEAEETDIPDVTFGYGKDRELLEIHRNNEDARVVTRCGGRGSSENLPAWYPNPSSKGTIAARGEGGLRDSAIEIVDMEAFARTVGDGASITYGKASVSVSNFRISTPETSSQDQDAFHSIGRVYPTPSGLAKPVTVTFDVSRDADDGGRDMMMFQILLRPLLRNEDAISRNPAWWQSEKALDEVSSGDTGYHLLNGYITVRNMSVYDQDYNPSASGDVYTFDRSFAFGTEMEENHGNVQHSFPLSPRRIFAESKRAGFFDVADYDKHNQAEILKRYKDDGWVIRTHTNDDRNKYYYALRPVDTYTYDNEDVIIMAWVRKGDVRHMRVTFDISVPALSFLGTDYFSYHSSVKVTVANAQEGEYSWYDENGNAHPLSYYGLRLVRTTPQPGYGIRQEILANVPASDALMPPVYRDTLGQGMLYPAVNEAYTETYPNGTSHVFGPYIDPAAEGEDKTVVFIHEYIPGKPLEHIQSFEDIRPSIKAVVNAAGLRIDEISDVYFEPGYDPELADGEDKYSFPRFFVRLRATDGETPFNLFACPNEKNEMALAMDTGSCGGCSFLVDAVDMGNNVFMNPVRVNPDGSLRKDAAGKVILTTSSADMDDSQQDTSDGPTWIALRPDRETYGMAMPSANANVRVKAGDRFVITGITMPSVFIEAAEKRLEDAIIKFMKENNEEKFSYSLRLSRTWLALHHDVRDLLSVNSALNIVYDGRELPLMYVKSYTYKASSDALPEISVELGDIVEVPTSGTMRKIEAAVGDAMDSLHANLGEIMAPYLRRDIPEEIDHTMTFLKGLQLGDYKAGMTGRGGSIGVDPSGDSHIEVDYLRVRRKATFTEIEVEKLKAVGGAIAVTMASGIILRTEMVGEDTVRCYLDTGDGMLPNEFEEGDLVRCQSFGVNPRFWWRKVTDSQRDYIEVSVSDCATDSDIPQAGDQIVQFGNVADPDRQKAILMSCYGSEAPSVVMYAGIDGYTLAGRDIAGFVADGGNGVPVSYVYGDAFIGDRQDVTDPGQQYIRYVTENGRRILEVNGAMLSNLMAVRDENGNVVAGMNGSDEYVDANGHRIMFFAGSASASKADVEKAATRICRDGEIFTGKLYADGGRIAGFDIEQNDGISRIGAISGSVTSTPKFAKEIYLGTSTAHPRANAFQFRGKVMEGGYDVTFYPAYISFIDNASSPMMTVFRDSSQGFPQGVALEVTSQGADDNVAVNVANGSFKGLRPYTRVIGVATTLDTETYNFVMDNTNATTVTLPPNPEKGHTLRIIKPAGTGNVTVKGREEDRMIRTVSNTDVKTEYIMTGGGIHELLWNGTQWLLIIVE